MDERDALRERIRGLKTSLSRYPDEPGVPAPRSARCDSRPTPRRRLARRSRPPRRGRRPLVEKELGGTSRAWTDAARTCRRAAAASGTQSAMARFATASRWTDARDARRGSTRAAADDARRSRRRNSSPRRRPRRCARCRPRRSCTRWPLRGARRDGHRAADGRARRRSTRRWRRRRPRPPSRLVVARPIMMCSNEERTPRR